MRGIVRPGVSLSLIIYLLAIEAQVGTAAVDERWVMRRCESIRQAVDHLSTTYKTRYPKGDEYRKRLVQLEQQAADGDDILPKLKLLRRAVLLDHPLVRHLDILLVRRRPKGLRTAGVVTEHDRSIGFSGGPGREIGFPSNHECNASLERHGYDNEIAVLGSDGQLTTLYRPDDGGYVGEIDLHWDGRRLLFTKSDQANWKIWEIHSDGSGLRQVSQMPDDVDCMDPCYLPNGNIVFGSTASYQSVPCWHGQKRVSNLYVMKADGSSVRQLCFDQDHDFHPCVLPTGQVLYHRWDYTGISHVFLRPLMVMNPDGTGQRAIYGSNSWFPNSLYFPRPVPDRPNELVSILSGYHGVHRMGQFVRIDVGQGWQEEEGLVQRFSGMDQPIQPRIKDALVDGDWPKFLHPYPISSDLFLVACWQSRQGSWGIYLADVFDNLVLIRDEPGWALLEPTPLMRRPMPPVIPDRVDLQDDKATVYLHDIHMGPGLAGVPRGVIQKLRVIAYHFGYRGLAGSDKIGYGGPWDAMQIVGTVPVEADGSAHFRVPANTPLSVQALDREGKAVQLMRSWFSAMPGEQLSCVGCHEAPTDSPQTRLGLAAQSPPREIDHWYGPPRGFDFAREVQPVLDRHCASCHDGTDTVPLDLRSEDEVPSPESVPIGYPRRMHPQMMKDTGGKLPYTPAYLALIHYIRRPNIEDDVSLLTPGEYHADTSELIQILRKGHYGVKLDTESWQRLVTWIDLNGPCHGTWQDVYPIPDNAYARRNELQSRFGGPKRDPEQIPASAPVTRQGSNKARPAKLKTDHTQRDDLPTPATQRPLPRKTVDLGDGVTFNLVKIPAGTLVINDLDDATVGRTGRSVTVKRSFWMATCEITNRQFRMFDAQHTSGYYAKRHAAPDDRGLPLDGDEQPVVRVSWKRAQEFCQWLSQRTGMNFRLPTETQWEYACRANTLCPLNYGSIDDDFSSWANLADRSFSRGLMDVPANRVYPPGVTQVTGGVPHLLLEGAKLSEARFHDRAVVTAAVASYRPNRWGLHDMHGNAAEWTQSASVPGGRFVDDCAANEPRQATRSRGKPDSRWLSGVISCAGVNKTPLPAGESLGEGPKPREMQPSPNPSLKGSGTFETKPSRFDGVEDEGTSSSARRHIVRGGSFFDRPGRAGSSFRLAYYPWQRIFNVGFRVVAEVAEPPASESSASGKSAEPLRLAFITCCKDGAFFEPVKRGMRDAAEQLQVDCHWMGTVDVDVEAQAALVRRALSQKYDGIALNIIDAEAFDNVVQRAKDQGVPVVAFNVDDHATPNARLSSVSQKLYDAGRQLAEHIAGSIPDGSHVLLTMHDEGVSALEDRRRGQQEALSGKNIRWTVITTGNDPQQGAEKIAQELRKHAEIRIVLSTGQADTEAAGRAIEEYFAGQGFWAAGFDLSPETLRLIQAGHIRCTVDQQPYIQGYYPVVQLVFYLRYGIRPSDVDAGATIIDRSNVERVIELTKQRFR